VHHALGDALAVEVLHLLEQLHILHQQRAARPGGEGVLRRPIGAPSAVVSLRLLGVGATNVPPSPSA
jgi:hypothetical protein